MRHKPVKEGVQTIRRIAAFLLVVGLASALSPARALPALPSGPSPPGANDFNCRPAAVHPRPVVLVHGIGPGMLVSWSLVAPALHARGYCVFAFDYGNLGIWGWGAERFEDSAEELRAFVDTVLAATGAATVDLVGWSGGAVVSRYYMRFLDGAAKVAQLVGVGPANHGTTNPGAAVLGMVGCCPAYAEVVAGSPFMVKLNAGGDTLPGIAYTVISTRHDYLVTPYTSQALAGPDVTNVVLQDRCPLNVADHFFITYNPVTLQWIENALDRGGPADPNFRPAC